MHFRYSATDTITASQFVDLLRRSSLAERRPVENPGCIEKMISNADLTITAWHGDQLIGVARSVTDFSWCCYLSDLAVDAAYQRNGIGRRLIAATQSRLEPTCKVILLAAPNAVDYYPRLGFVSCPSAWMIDARTNLL